MRPYLLLALRVLVLLRIEVAHGRNPLVGKRHVIGVLNVAPEFEQLLFVGILLKRDFALQVQMLARDHRPFGAHRLHKIPALACCQYRADSNIGNAVLDVAPRIAALAAISVALAVCRG